MSPSKYSNFDLEIYKDEGEYLVKARSFAGEATHKFSLPFTHEEAKEFIVSVESAISQESIKIDFVKKFGGLLFEAVFQSDIRALYKSSLDLMESKQGTGLRVRLHLQYVPEFSHLPWEYLYQATTNQFLCLNRQTPIVRYLDIPKIISPLQIKPPLRILVMISSPKNLTPLDVNNEKNKIKKTLAELEKKGLVEINILKEATVTELQQTLRRSEFHIFHFIGHGDFDKVNNQGLLAFEDDDELVDYVNAEQLGALLFNHRSFRLVVLNSCEGARTSLTNPFAGTATTLMQLGIPSVVAMQFVISDSAAINFVSVFYASIADGLPVDMAVTEARVAIFSGEDHIEWGTPVLFMRSSDGSLFNLKEKSSDEYVITNQAREKYPKKLSHLYAAVMYFLVTLLFGVITFFILSVLPKSTVIEMDVFAKRISFSLPPEITRGEEVPLLYSGLWTKSISIEKFHPIELTIDSLFAPIESSGFQNPLIITPDPLNGRVTFNSKSADISLQEIICDSASIVSFHLDDEDLFIEIQESSNDPYLSMSFGDYTNIAVQACTVRDGANNDFTQLFRNPVTVRLHDFSRSLNLQGEKGNLITIIAKAKAETEEPTQFILEERVSNLDFSKNIFQNFKTIRQSTVDSIFVKRNFPLDNPVFLSSGAGELEVIADPNKFIIFDLSQTDNLLKLTAQGRLKSLKIGRGALMSEMVPGYLSLITRHPITLVLITWIGWLLIVLRPFVLRIYKK
ncbi:MAG: CHAT domain-containing protein [bacterium]